LIRAARPEDREAIAAINAEGQPGVTAFESGEIEHCIARATLFRVAEREGAVRGYLLAFGVGFAAIGDEYAWFAARHPAFLYVDQIAVARSAWRAGVGAALYAELEGEARARRPRAHLRGEPRAPQPALARLPRGPGLPRGRPAARQRRALRRAARARARPALSASSVAPSSADAAGSGTTRTDACVTHASAVPVWPVFSTHR